jgi:hypothetical protein
MAKVVIDANVMISAAFRGNPLRAVMIPNAPLTLGRLGSSRALIYNQRVGGLFYSSV